MVLVDTEVVFLGHRVRVTHLVDQDVEQNARVDPILFTVSPKRVVEFPMG